MGGSSQFARAWFARIAGKADEAKQTTHQNQSAEHYKNTRNRDTPKYAKLLPKWVGKLTEMGPLRPRFELRRLLFGRRRLLGALLQTRWPIRCPRISSKISLGVPSRAKKIDLAPLGPATKRQVDRFQPSGGSLEASRRVPERLRGGLFEGTSAKDVPRSKS